MHFNCCCGCGPCAPPPQYTPHIRSNPIWIRCIWINLVYFLIFLFCLFAYFFHLLLFLCRLLHLVGYELVLINSQPQPSSTWPLRPQVLRQDPDTWCRVQNSRSRKSSVCSPADKSSWRGAREYPRPDVQPGRDSNCVRPSWILACRLRAGK